MAALTITASQVVPDTSGKRRTGVAGAAIAVGKAVYYSATANTWNLADADALATVKEGEDAGIAISASSAANQYVTVQTTGSPTIGAGAAPAAGTIYVVGLTAGDIVPDTDLGAGDFPCILGPGSGTNQITLGATGTILGQTAHA